MLATLPSPPLVPFALLSMIGVNMNLLQIVFLKSAFRERERGRSGEEKEKNNHLLSTYCPLTYAHWLLLASHMCPTGDGTHDPYVSGWHSDQLNYRARAYGFVFWDFLFYFF